MICEMCGSKDATQKCIVEGSELLVCDDCAVYGKTISRFSPAPIQKMEAQRPRHIMMKEDKELLELIVPDYAKLIKSAREKLGLKQEELAKKIAEKESKIHKMESGLHEPSIDVARKLERFLKITLVMQHEEKHQAVVNKKSEGLTLGDILQVKKK